ncbi:MAG TPA: sn-glycerol-3-phosphate ABC transporter ATP-binding protein UgpC [Termitinemataceae bacterium]|jgi:multiple sugar transport system ATP-binding protein|uniref:ABC transporter ATP-binding protein n=1 Tax=Treponema sp. J25 TaxID=2094121 RepID=UPI001044352A|nr:sn-glycerol-3-phosphate ABC transporter ATP-binding protein UgpC [Treponema sp. J25]TCW62574.1 sugar ABC transporter ATP-binding protein [Treponema sp. J25]HOJ98254.1 sn-glycerol-3-phosphate ABC transporter ATP-binding protein UgpC [Termitinemataceae bacterium]HOM22617.1 sn-glycerol-3-phosphate ABC transporter ATP-binding protein UgpC [Termitinemataceae bacterium]HPP99457.1 sn-glycerol-3-phosphate ABC transporter ATP-binding protein UgpC [Termitinemataceae bacterium]
MAKVELKGVSKVYEGNVRAVDNANITVNDKEFVVFVGPSGCGKSTTLRMIAGLEDITEGELYIDGELMNDVPPKDRNIAMVFQNYALYPHMTVYDNMAFGLRIKKVDKAEIDRRVHEAARILDIEKFLDRKPKALSGGQRQRVAVGRAIVRNPKVFLFDEPLSNLDAKLRVQMRAELSDLHLRLNATMIYVTHDQVEAMTMASKIVVMKDGKIQQIGSPLYLYNHPINKFVAGFIGSPPMNFLSVKVLEKNGSIILDEGSFEVKPMDEHVKYLKKYVGKEIFFGIRPEDLTYVESPAASNNIPVKITVVEPLGADIHLWLTTKTQPLVARTEPHHTFHVGDQVNFVPHMEKAHYFDKDTELSILAEIEQEPQQ